MFHDLYNLEAIFLCRFKEHITTTSVVAKPTIVGRVVTIGLPRHNSRIAIIEVLNMAKDDNLGYDIEEDFENDFDEKLDKVF